jgi:hypothetical protein
MSVSDPKPYDPATPVPSNVEFERKAKRTLRRHADVAADGSFEFEWDYFLDPGSRVVRLTVFYVGNGPRKVENVVEVSEPGPGPMLYDWAVGYCGIEDGPEARQASGFDPRRVSEGATDDWFDLADDLRELRNRLDGWVVAAGERGERVDAELAVEVSEALAALTGRVEEVSGV